MGGNRILLVDDEELVLRGLARALKGNGFHVSTAATGEDALRALEGCTFDLCFLDIRLPGISGIQVLDRIREQSPGTKVVVISASHLDRSERAYIEKNAHHFMPKPLDLSDVRVLVRQTLEPNSG